MAKGFISVRAKDNLDMATVAGIELRKLNLIQLEKLADILRPHYNMDNMKDLAIMSKIAYHLDKKRERARS